jgi:hypothetical protein
MVSFSDEALETFSPESMETSSIRSMGGVVHKTTLVTPPALLTKAPVAKGGARVDLLQRSHAVMFPPY